MSENTLQIFFAYRNMIHCYFFRLNVDFQFITRKKPRSNVTFKHIDDDKQHQTKN